MVALVAGSHCLIGDALCKNLLCAIRKLSAPTTGIYVTYLNGRFKLELNLNVPILTVQNTNHNPIMEHQALIFVAP
jgi:hypothetical protein